MSLLPVSLVRWHRQRLIGDLSTAGSFEFLPVTVNTSGVTFDATLRMFVTTGLNMSAELGDVIQIGAGASATVYTDLAHFVTNITPSDQSHVLKARDGASYSDGCELPVVETYEFGLGANAGAYVEFESDSWGPSPKTSIQVYYTTLLSACAASAASAASGKGRATSSTVGAKRTGVSELDGRVDKSLTLTSTSIVYTVTNVICQSTGLRDCPVSLQHTVQTTKTSMYTTSLPSGSKITSVPQTTTTGSLVGVQSFGSGFNKLAASSGSPKAYTPSSSSGASSSTTSKGAVQSAIDDAKSDLEGMSADKKKLIIGLSAGIGGTVLVGVIACIT